MSLLLIPVYVLLSYSREASLGEMPSHSERVHIDALVRHMQECLDQLDGLGLHLPAAHLDLALIELRQGRLAQAEVWGTAIGT